MNRARLALAAFLAVGSLLSEGARASDAAVVPPVDLGGFTLLPQSGPPAGLRALRSGETDVSVTGHHTSSNTLLLTLALGPLFTKGVKVYSEPSHTLLIVGMTGELGETAAGHELKRQSLSFTGTFPDTVRQFELPPAPSYDSAILVYLIGEKGDYLVGAGSVHSGEFVFDAICRACR